MKREYKDGGIRLKELGIRPSSFDSKALSKEEFEYISSVKACDLINTIKVSCNDEEAFELTLDLLRKHPNRFEYLCDNPEEIENNGIDRLYQLTDNPPPINNDTENSYTDDDDVFFDNGYPIRDSAVENYSSSFKMRLNGEYNSDSD